MSLEIPSPPANKIACPYCKSNEAIASMFAEDPSIDGAYACYHCNTCELPFMTKTEIIIHTTIHRIEGIEPAVKTPTVPIIDADIVAEDTKEFIESLPQCTCFRCGRKFNSENPCKLKGEIYCSDCFEKVTNNEDSELENQIERYLSRATHPDPDQFLCSGCGTLHPKTNGTLSVDGREICKSCFEEELNECEQKHSGDEQEEVEYQFIPGSKCAQYRCIEGNVELMYSGYSHTILDISALWEIADGPRTKQKNKIMDMLGDQATKNRISAANMFVNALRTEAIPEAQESDQ